MGKDPDSGPLDGNDPGRRGGVSGTSDKIGVVGRADQAEDEDTKDVEQEDTDPDTTDGTRDVLCWVAGFGGGHSENLSSQEGVGSSDQNRPETGKTTQGTGDTLVLNERAGVIPIAEAETVVGRGTTQIDNETKDDETNNGEDLDGGEPELAFTEGAGTQKVDDDDNDTGDGDPYGIVDLVVPVVDEDGGGGQLSGEGDDPIVPVIPAHRKSHGWVNETSGEGHLTTGYGEECGQFAQGQHDGDADGRDDDVTEQKAQRATSCEGPGGTQKETSADDASDGDHLGVAVLQATLELIARAILVPLECMVDGFFLVVVRHRGLGDIQPEWRGVEEGM